MDPWLFDDYWLYHVLWIIILKKDAMWEEKIQVGGAVGGHRKPRRENAWSWTCTMN